MKTFAKVIRVITVAPFMAALLLFLIYIGIPQSFRTPIHVVVMNVMLVLFPLLAYPIQHKYQIIQGKKREAERKLAIIFSFVGYLVGIAFGLIFGATAIELVIYFTYFLSGLGIAVFSFGLKRNASGHMCGVVGPTVMLVAFFGWGYLFLLILPLFVIWSSLALKRHSVQELILGSLIPVLAFLVSMLIVSQDFSLVIGLSSYL